MNNNQYIKLRGFKRKWDFGECWSPKGKRFNKKRARKRFRQQLKTDIKEFD